MLTDFIPLVVPSTLTLPFNESGHIFYRPVPCTVIGRYSEDTGTIVIETVIAEGRHYDMLEILDEDWQKFYDELKQAVLTLDF